MRGFTATGDIWNLPIEIITNEVVKYFVVDESSKIFVFISHCFVYRSPCFVFRSHCLDFISPCFVFRSPSLARASSDTQHALARRIDCGWELPGRRPGGGLVRQWSRRKWWIQRPRQGRLIISYQGRSRAGFLPSFRYDTCGGGRYLIDLL